MKKIEAVIQPHKFDEVREALKTAGVEGMTISEVHGHGRQKGHTEVYRGSEYKIDLRPKIRIDIVVADSDLDRIVGVISEAARSGKIGDGKIFVSSIEEVYRIRNGDHGEGAL
jgi:nitrogen regulatory protein P-II 1